MADDLPTDVETVLTQLFAAGKEALETDDPETCRQTIGSAESVATNKLPEGDRKERILHGCERVRALISEEETAAAIEYLNAMERQFTETDG